MEDLKSATEGNPKQNWIPLKDIQDVEIYFISYSLFPPCSSHSNKQAFWNWYGQGIPCLTVKCFQEIWPMINLRVSPSGEVFDNSNIKKPKVVARVANSKYFFPKRIKVDLKTATKGRSEPPKKIPLEDIQDVEVYFPGGWELRTVKMKQVWSPDLEVYSNGEIYWTETGGWSRSGRSGRVANSRYFLPYHAK